MHRAKAARPDRLGDPRRRDVIASGRERGALWIELGQPIGPAPPEEHMEARLVFSFALLLVLQLRGTGSFTLRLTSR